ncbi:hypothetical protein F2Q69_00021839, partial [Brassica cretica]
MVCPTCHGELDMVRPTRHMSSLTRSIERSDTRPIASWTWSALFAIQEVGRGRDELALYRQCAENRDKVLRVRLQESEHKLGISMPIDLAKERITQLEAKATSLESVPVEVFEDSDPLWRAFAVGYFVGDAPHVGSIHAMVNRIWTLPGLKGKIDVRFIAKDTGSPETPATLPDLSAMPLWVDLKSVPSHIFSQVGLKALSKPVGSFIKLHPQMDKCTRLDLAGVLIEANLHKPLIEVIKFSDRDGSQVKGSPETPATLPDLSAMPLWVDLKSVPSHIFSQVGLKALSKPVGSFIKLHPQMDKCTRLDLAGVLIEANLHKPLIEVIKFSDRDGSQVK